MHIVEVSQYFPPYRGGQERYVSSLSEELAASQNRVDVLTTTITPEGASAGRPNPKIFATPPICTPLNNAVTFLPFRFRGLIRSADVVHLHNEHSLISLLAFLVRLHHGPVVITLHGQLKFGNPVLDWLARVYRSTVGRTILHGCDRIFVNSPEDKLDAARRGIDSRRIVEVSNAIDTERLGRSLGRSQPGLLRKVLGISKDTDVVLFVGRLIPRKGVRTLLSAFRVIRARKPSAGLVIVGDGPLLSVCQRFSESAIVKGRVSIFTNVSDEELYQLYQEAKVVAMPSISEVCPTVILESLYFGCRIVATDIPGIRDHFSDVATLVSPCDPTELADAVLRALDEPGHEINNRPTIRQEFLEKYTWKRVSAAYLRHFEELDVSADGRRGLLVR